MPNTLNLVFCELGVFDTYEICVVTITAYIMDSCYIFSIILTTRSSPQALVSAASRGSQEMLHYSIYKQKPVN